VGLPVGSVGDVVGLQVVVELVGPVVGDFVSFVGELDGATVTFVG
jgi:hypothetical protein